ncbi:MAG: Fur family transcriptional regulator [Phycisphaerales bacterium]
MARQTSHTLRIRDTIAAAPGPLTVDEIRDQLRETGVGIATVYRVVNTGVEEGWLRRVQISAGPARYEASDLGHHHHFECEGCGQVFDIEGCPGGMDRLVPPGFRMSSHEIVIRGLCDACNRRRG